MIFRTKNNVALFAVLALCMGLAIAIFAPMAANAQLNTGSIGGVITDNSGAVIANAAIKIKNDSTGAIREITTNGKGEYTVSQLLPAIYTLTITATGFEPVSKNVPVAVGSTNTVSLKLSVAGTKTTVIVAADSTVGVQLEKAEISDVIGSQQIENLPTVDRNPYGLVSLAGNMTTDDSPGSNRGVGFNIGGSRSADVDILLDGAENTNLYTVSIGQSVPMDAMQEFRVVAAGAGAEYGRGGGAVNVATKSGTNQWHGSVYEFNRISTLASDGFNNNAVHAAYPTVTAKPRYTHNQYGYSVGGPIKKDKMFFFSSTEWTKIRSAALDVAVVPTTAFIAMTNANTQAFFAKYGALDHPINGQTFKGSDAAVKGIWNTDINSVTTGIAATNPSLAASINSTAIFGQSIFNIPANSGGGDPVDQWVTFNRFDWTISPTLSMYARYIQQSSIYPTGYVNASPYKGFNTSEKVANHNLMVSVSKAFSPRLALTTKLLLTRNNDSQPLGTQPVSPTLYINSSAAVSLGGGTINLPGYSQTSPGNAIPFGGPQNEIEFAEDGAWTLGKNQITFGGEYLYIRDNRMFGAYENAVDALVQSGTTGALKNFVNGNFAYLNVAINPQGKYPCAKSATSGATLSVVGCQITMPVGAPNFSRSNRYHDFAFYVQDSYKLNSRLTVNAGVRWEIYGTQHSQQAGYDANFYPATSGNVWQQFANGQILTRDKAPNGRLWALNLKQFAPKLGLAFDPVGDGKTSIRAGFGLNYERNFGNVTYNIIQNPPNYGVVSFTSADNGGALLPISTNNFSTMGTQTGTKNMPQVTLRAVNPNIKPAYNVNYTVAIQRQIGNSTLGLEYIGSRGIHNYTIANYNRAYVGGNYLGYGYTAGRDNLQYSSINYRGADGDSYHNGLNFSLRTNNLHNTGLSGTTNFTWGHSIDNTSSTFTDGSSNTMNGIAYLDPYNHGLDRGASDFDKRLRITTGLMWKVPTVKSLTGVAKAITSGWTMGTTFSASTGNPFSMFDCSYAAQVCPRAAFVSDPSYKKGRNMIDISGDYGPNTYSYIKLPDFWDTTGYFASGVNEANYNEQIHPVYGVSDTPICSGLNGVGCHWVKNMSQRNAFRGPGNWGQDLAVLKDFKVHERYGVQFKAEFINLYNHANTYLNLGGASDVSSYTDVLAYKSGNRNTELSVHVSF